MPRYNTRRPKPKPRQNALPLWLGLAGLVLLVIAVWAIFNNNSQTKANIEVKGSPRLKVEQPVIDHGDVKLGTPVRDDIRVTNVGDQTLRFIEEPYIEIKEGCWPPTPVIGSMTLQPGESTVITLEYLMHGEMGGKHDFRLQLLTNDKTQPEQEVQIVSNWVP